MAVPVKRRNASFFLLPLIAAMLFYPGGSAKVSTGSSEILGSQDKPRQNTQRKLPEEWQRGRQAVQWFFNPPAGSKWGKDPRDNATIKFLIATVPDPVDSGLPHVYDRYMGAIQAALNSQPYFLSKFDLPWEDCLAKGKEKEKDDKDAESDDQMSSSSDQPDAACKNRRYRKEPGFLLLSNPSGKSPTTEDADTSRPDLLLIYLVGETPAAGIQKRALYSALNEISWFCGWRESTSPSSDATLRSMARCGDRANEVRILGPSYSGSAQSLDLALSGWADSIPDHRPTLQVTMISGIATAIVNPDEKAVDKDRERAKSDFYHIRQRLDARFSFRSMSIPDDVAENKLCSFLREQNKVKLRHIRVAVLSEGGTAYGNRQEEELRDKTQQEESDCDGAIQKTLLPYPAHISQLRAVSEKLRQSQRDASPEPQISGKNLPLAQSLEDAGTRRDVQTFSPANAVTAEQVMANLLFTISRERFDYVGILATDTRDTMFLAQEVREHSPSSVLFTYGGDLLFLHPEINQTLRGMLIVSSYPVNNAFQSWMLPGDSVGRLQFPDDGTEGVYNATLALLGDDRHMVEFSSPLPGKQMKARPPVWITVVGRNRLWPVKTYDLSSNAAADKYLYVPTNDLSRKLTEASLWRGLYSEGTLILAGAFAVLCIGFGLPLLKRFGQGRASGARLKGFLGEVVSDEHHRAGELALLAGCASLGTFLIVLVTTLCIPAGAIRLFTNQGEGLPWEAIAAILSVCIAAIVLGAASVGVLRGVLKERRGAENPIEWAPFAAGSAASVSLALALAAAWIFQFGWGDRLAAVFASLRSLNMLSGVSALTPLLCISIAGFVWAVATYKRIRLLDDLEERSEETVFNHLKLSEVRRLYDNLRSPSLELRASRVVVALAGLAGLYLWFHLVHSLEFGWFYTLLVVSFFFVSLALWQAVLRFWLVWSETHRFLRHLALTPLRAACKRFRESFPVLPKIDLASSAASLARLECSTEQARTLWLRAKRVMEAAQVRVKASGGATLIMMDPVEFDALTDLKSDAMKSDIDEATRNLVLAREVGAQEGKADLNHEYESRKALSEVTERVAKTLQNSWWTEIHERPGEGADPLDTERAKVFGLAEEFMAGRVAHSLACVFQHMQNLICTAVMGLLLLLFTVSSYPFQPHNVLLLFNWIIILSVVGIALWVFIQMSRDPILSYLSGTKPGQISWDSEFIFRIFTYGIVPILALLGAQFPQSVGQILSHLMSGDAIHP